MNRTPPLTPARIITRSRLSRKNSSQRQQNKDCNLSSTPTTPQRSNYSPVTQDSPGFIASSQDPSREIIWEMRPLSPLTQSERNDDFMINLCNSWKTIKKTNSPVGSHSLSNLWNKPQSTPVKSHSERNLRSSKITEAKSPDIPKSNEMLEIQKINALLRSRNHTKNIDVKSNASKTTEQSNASKAVEQVINEETDLNLHSRLRSPIKDVSNTILKEESRLVLDKSQDIFSEDEILAPDSCRVESADSEEDLWGDEDESLIRGLSQAEIPELNAAFLLESQTIPSTLSCENRKSNVKNSTMEIFKPLEEVTLNIHKEKPNSFNIVTRAKSNQVSQSESETNKKKLNNLVSEKIVPLIDLTKDIEVGVNSSNCPKSSKTNLNEYSDELFSDDDFCISQDIISILDQRVDSTSGVVANPEPSLSQKRRATADEIARKREEALKLRQMKMKKITNNSSKRSFVRTNSGAMR